MVKSKSSNKSKQQKVIVQTVRLNPPSKRKAQSRVPRNPSILSDGRVARWDQLLRDPCASNLAPPCYGGCDTGYLVRTVDSFAPTYVGSGFTTGSTYFGNFGFQYTPSNASTVSGITTSSGASFSVVANGTLNFITNGAAVKRYRPVAACVKYLPYGAYSTRAGIIGMGYSPGMVEIPSADTMPPLALLQMCQHQAPVGAETHEVRWLPTVADETFTSVTAPSNSGAGSVFISLINADGVATSATTFVFNGYIEITTVWEWLPNGAQGIAVSPTAPLPFTTQQVLATISDMGAYLFSGVRRAASSPGFINASSRIASGLLTRGVGQVVTRNGRAIMS